MLLTHDLWLSVDVLGVETERKSCFSHLSLLDQGRAFKRQFKNTVIHKKHLISLWCTCTVFLVFFLDSRWKLAMLLFFNRRKRQTSTSATSLLFFCVLLNVRVVQLFLSINKTARKYDVLVIILVVMVNYHRMKKISETYIYVIDFCKVRPRDATCIKILTILLMKHTLSGFLDKKERITFLEFLATFGVIIPIHCPTAIDLDKKKTREKKAKDNLCISLAMIQ